MIRRTRRGAARAPWIALALAVVGGGLAYTLTRPPAPPKFVPPPLPPGAMTEAERLEYVKVHVKVEGLEVGAETRDEGNTVIPGVLLVTGELVNTGDRKLGKAVVALYPKDEAGEVIAAQNQDVLAKRGPLEPGGRRSFSITMPQLPDFGGEMGHGVR